MPRNLEGVGAWEGRAEGEGGGRRTSEEAPVGSIARAERLLSRRTLRSIKRIIQNSKKNIPLRSRLYRKVIEKVLFSALVDAAPT